MRIVFTLFVLITSGCNTNLPKGSSVYEELMSGERFRLLAVDSCRDLEKKYNTDWYYIGDDLDDYVERERNNDQWPPEDEKCAAVNNRESYTAIDLDALARGAPEGKTGSTVEKQGVQLIPFNRLERNFRLIK